jgi:cyclophilin family peptidyl-prolyl cis-trans isomerase
VSKLKFLPLACLLAGLFLAANADAANSVVRFRISYGYTPFGDIDVELFDDAKPITVTNFLYQVQTDAYDRTFLHRVVPEFVLQGGLYSVENPYTTDFFKAMKRIPEGPPITNEFNVGPRISNTFGTLAMALSSTNIAGNDYPLLDTATTSWFFNLVDNTDQLDPNYVVFGRVKSGASKLNFFNTLAEDAGVIVMQTDLFRGTGLSWLFSQCNDPVLAGEGQIQLEALPVAYFFFDCPFYSDLFNVQISMVSGRDVAPPKITIAPIGVKQTISNDTHLVSGTVTDNMGVDQVRVYLGAGNAVLADLNTNTHTWSATLTNIPPGTNIVYVEATDFAGNRVTKPGTFFRSVTAPIGLSIAGTGCRDMEVVTTNAMSELVTNFVTVCGGTITGATNGQPLEIGRAQKITAVPAPGNLFAGWYENGLLVWSAPTYPFFIDLSQTNRNITAAFNTNLFPYVKGTYTGIFCNSEQVEEVSSGFFSLTVGDVGTYSAKVSMGGKTYPMTGTFDSGSGKNLNFLFRPESNQRLTSEVFWVRMTLDLTPESIGGSGHLSGTFSNAITIGVITNVLHEVITTNIDMVNGIETYVTNFMTVPETNYFNTNWTAELHADRAVYSATRPAPQEGKYTLLIPAATNSTSGPFGDGYGRATINSKGSLTFSGSLADGTKVTQKAAISKNGNWPLYLSLYKKKGMLLSRILIDTNQTDDLSGLMNWFKRTQVAKYYGTGFTNESMIIGSRFTPPTATTRLLELTAGVAGFTNGGLVADFANDVTLDAAGKVTNLDTNKLSLNLNKSSGLITGAVTPPTGGRSLPIKGAVLQRQNRGSGYFLGTNNTSGRVSLGQ